LKKLFIVLIAFIFIGCADDTLRVSHYDERVFELVFHWTVNVSERDKMVQEYEKHFPHDKYYWFRTTNTRFVIICKERLNEN